METDKQKKCFCQICKKIVFVPKQFLDEVGKGQMYCPNCLKNRKFEVVKE